MNPLELMEQKKEHFTPNEMQIYETIMADPSQIVSLTTSALAKKSGVSQPAITRFIKNLGYSRFQEFRADLIRCAPVPDTQKEEEGPQELSCTVPSLTDMVSIVRECEPQLNQKAMDSLAEYVLGFRRIYTTGISKSYQPAELMEILSRKLDLRIHAVRQDFLYEVCDYLTEQDLLIIFSVSGHPDIMKLLPSSSCPILMVTCNPHPENEKKISRLICFDVGNRNPEDVPISPVLFDIFVDLLVKAMIRMKAGNE